MLHERTHIADRRYKCSQCGRTYPCLSDFHVHLNSHIGEKRHGRPSDGVKGSGRNALRLPHRGTRLAEEFGFESGEEDEGPVVSAQEVQPQALLPQAPQVSLAEEEGNLGM
ncbi:UNVERIFIED_CONTAM: hypothetical protein K2H54_066809 [Gekko kuhli]